MGEGDEIRTTLVFGDRAEILAGARISQFA